MLKKNVLERYLKALLDGDRIASRSVIEEALQCGVPANAVYSDIIWPIMVEIEKLEKEDKISSVQEALATRINRSIVDQLQNKLPRKASVSKKVVVYSTATERGELGAQMITDLFESSGWEVRYVGSGVTRDDLVEFTHSYRPAILLIYGMQADKAPETRQLIDNIKSINACPDMKIMLSGGIFDRAEGLWEEIGADMYAATAAQAVQIATANDVDVPKPQRTINRRKKKSTMDKIAEALEPILS
ncbi:MAG: cobalamin-dependent protein [Phycisphaerae bacterium]|nr:cobalamin-dependent protein [Phycisphaerae bacterium]